MDDLKERATNLAPLTAPVADSSSDPTMEKSPTDKENILGTLNGLIAPKNWPTMEEILNPKGPYIQKWNIVFIVSCLLAVLLDPLFLYIPTINEDLKCVGLDKNLMVAALVFRSVTDLLYLLNIFLQVCGSKTCSSLRSGSCSPMLTRLRTGLLSIAKAMWKSYIIIDILAILPLPQVAVLIIFPTMRGLGSSGTEKLINFLVIVQYAPRVLRIYLSCKEYNKISREETPIWVKCVLNFLMYILSSHVFGSLCYFFAIQRITSCWRHACRNEKGCDPNSFDCHNHHTSRNITFLNDLCSADSSDRKTFDFGIYLNILQFGILGSSNYSEKFSNCFWWGLRNLSSLGSNLEPSVSTWENLFSAFISLVGLLLFVYLIGNLQTYMQLDTARLETHRWKQRIENKLKKKNLEFEPWLAKNGIPLHKKPEIMAKVLVELKENRDVTVENLLEVLPPDLQSYMKSCMPLERLKKVSSIKNMDEAVPKEISKYLKPQKYGKDDTIITEDKPLETMIFIVDGLVSIEKSGCSITLKREAGDVYGEQLFCWPAWTSSPGLSNESVRAVTDVNVLVLTASDMERVGCKFKSNFDQQITPLLDAKWELLENDHVAMLRKVPKLGAMDSQVLKAICQRLKPMSYRSGTWLNNNDGPLRVMAFVTGGRVLISSRPGYAANEYEDGWLVRHAGFFFGEEVLDWILDGSFPALVPVSNGTLWADNVDVLILTIEDLASVVSEYRSSFMKVIIRPRVDLFCAYRMHWLKKVPILRDMDEEVLKEISTYLQPRKYKKNDTIIEEDKPLAMTIFVLTVGRPVSISSKDTTLCWIEAGDFGGEQLLYWPAWTSIVSLETFGAGNEVDVLVLMASDIERIGHKFRWDVRGELLDTRLVALLKRVPKLETMDAQVLKAVSLHMKPMSYSCDEQLIEKDKPLRMMIFVVAGSLHISNRPFAVEEFKYGIKRPSERQIVGEELLHWVLDTSFPALLPMSTYDVVVASERADVFVLMAEDLATVVPEHRSDISRVITPPPTELITVVGLRWLEKVAIFRNMDELVLKEISQHLKLMSYSSDSVIIEEPGPLEMMLFLVDGDSVCAAERRYDVGEFYGAELVHWITNWASHTSFPARLPLSPCSVRVNSNGKDNAQVLVLRSDDLKRIVSKFRREFMKQTTLPIDSEGKLATLDPLTMLKSVPMLINMDDEVLKAICSHLKPMKYSDDASDGRCMFRSKQKIDKMLFIKSGLVAFTYNGQPRSYRYTGNYFGEQLLEWALDATVHKIPRLKSREAFMCVGEVEVLVLTVEDLAKVASEFMTRFRQITPADFLLDSDPESSDSELHQYARSDSNSTLLESVILATRRHLNRTNFLD